MGISDLSRWLTNLVSSDLLETRLESMLLGLRANLKTRSAQLHEVSSAYANEKLVLVLGAGVSHDYLLPSWSSLLQQLLIRSLADGGGDAAHTAAVAEVYSQLFDPDPLIAARYIRLNMSTEQFARSVREILYAKVATNFVSPLMRAIRNLAVAPGKAPNLDSIITFNYDDVLEECLRGLAIDVPFHVVSDNSIKAVQGSLPIYHVHGYLPRDGEIKSDSTIVLSEDDYHSLYADIYNWSNIVQINKFRENTCLFIGLSFSDPNLRRLLDIAQRQRGESRPQHFLFRRKYSTKEAFEKLLELRRNKRPDNSSASENETPADAATSAPSAGEPPQKSDGDASLRELAKKVVELISRFDEQDANSFGATVIWVDDYAEIPSFLDELYRDQMRPASQRS